MNFKNNTVKTGLCLAAVLSAVLTVRAAFYSADYSPVMAPFSKNGSSGTSVTFTEDDFTSKTSANAALDGVIISELPDQSAGVLKLDGRELLCLEGIDRESFSKLEFEPVSDSVETAAFKVVPVFEGAVSADEIAITVNLSEKAGTPPIAENLSFETYKNIAICGKFKSVDNEGGEILYTVTDKPKFGEITIENDGFRYVPYQDKTGNDWFSYVATDDKGNSSEPAKIEIKIKKRNGKSDISYKDMESSAAHYAAIRLSELDVITGEKIGAAYFFNPDKTVSRSEFVAMAVTAANIATPAASFNTGLADDESISAWAKPYVSAALNAGIIKGALNSDGSRVFRPDDDITRAEAAVILNNIASLASDGRQTSFTDAEEVPVWAQQAVANVDAARIVSFDNGAVNASEKVLRADAAQMIYNAICLINARNK